MFVYPMFMRFTAYQRGWREKTSWITNGYNVIFFVPSGVWSNIAKLHTHITHPASQ